MPTNKKPAKKAVPQKAKATKAAPKKAVKQVKATPKKVAAKPAKATKPAKPQANKAIAKSVKNTAPVKKAAVKPVVVPAKKVEQRAKPETVKKIVSAPPPVVQVKPTPSLESSKPAVKAKVKAEEVKPSKPVVIPKLSTNTARKYEPEFTQSVLDRPEAQQNGPVMRYSDAELVEFRELIQRKLDAAKKELSYLQGLITRKDDMGGDESENRYMTMEDGSISMEREQLSQMASRQIQYIDHLEKAMMRIENKTYGICRVTGRLIDKARLRAVPHATLSIEAKMGYAKNPNIQ